MNDLSSTRLVQQIKMDPMQYVSELTSKPSVTLDALLNARKSVQSCADETNTQLKKNVYKNYQLFIDTSKEISFLKSEMSQLNRYLNEEYKLLDQLLGISIGGSKAGLTASEKKEALDKVKEERERKMLQMSLSNQNGPLPTKEFKSLIDNIEGGVGILENRLNCLVYYEGEVVELDEDYQELPTLYLVLLNDALILSTLSGRNRQQNTLKKSPITNSIVAPGQRKYKFHSIIDLESIAVVNVKDRRYVKFELAFKILMTSSSKIFLTTSPAKKKAWIEAFEIAKKYRRTHRLQRRDTMFMGSSQSSSTISSSNSNFDIINTSANSNSTANKSTGYSSVNLNPFDDTELEESHETDPELPYWLVELPDDLDVYIAQRNFEDAVKLVSRAHEHFYMYPKWCDNQMQVDLKLKIDNKISELVDALTAELNIAADRSLQTGPRASRRAVSLLLRLGKSSLAIRLFLDQRTKLLKHHFKNQKASDTQTLTFMKRMTNLFFSQIVETSKEFLRAFEIEQSDLMPNADGLDSLGESNKGPTWFSRQSTEDPVSNEMSSGLQSSLSSSYSHTALACLNAWNYQQLTLYLNLFSNHVFINQVNTLVATECVSLAIHHCVKLRQTIGVDFLFVLSREFKMEISRLIEEIRDKFLEAIKLRSSEDRQQLLLFDSRNKLNKFLSDMQKYDLTMDEYIRECNDDGKTTYSIHLTNNTVTFVKSYINTMKDLLKLSSHPTMIKLINEALIVALKAQMKHMVACLKAQTRDRELIRHSIIFILEKMIPTVIQRYCDTLHVRTFHELQVLSIDYAYLKDSNASFSGGSTPDKHSPYGSPIPTPRARKSQIQIGSNKNQSGETPSTTTSSSMKNYSMATYL